MKHRHQTPKDTGKHRATSALEWMAGLDTNRARTDATGKGAPAPKPGVLEQLRSAADVHVRLQSVRTSSKGPTK